MERREITAALVAEAERMLANGIDCAAIVAQLGISKYVLWLIYRNRDLVFIGKPSPATDKHILSPNKNIPYTTVRMIERMLEVGILSHKEIAREAGVSANTVSEVVTGKRMALTLTRPAMVKFERFHAKPMRCTICGAQITVSPCRVCSMENIPQENV